MEWCELYSAENEPSEKQIKKYVDSPLWDDLTDYIQQTFKSKPKLSYSNCAMDKGFWKGWNVKYKKSGRALCTLYPKKGFILSLVPIGLRDMNEAELLMPLCTEYVQSIFKQAPSMHIGKSLAIEVRDEDVLNDLKSLIKLRAG